MGRWASGLIVRSAAEGDGVDDAYRDGMSVVAAGSPVRHFGEDSGGLAVERFLAASEHFDVGNVSVRVDDKTAGDASLDASVVGFAWILAVGVDIGEKSLCSAGEFRFLIHIVVFEHFLHCLASVGRVSGVHAASLGAIGSREKDGEEACEGYGEESGDIESRGVKSHERFLSCRFNNSLKNESV